MNEFIQTFHIDWKLMIAQIVNFGLVFLVFYLLAAKPLSKLIKDRTEKIETGLLDAKQNAVLLEKTQKEYDEIIIKARAEADRIFQSGKQEAETKKVSMLEDAKTEVAKMIEGGKKDLETEKIKMVANAKKEVASLVVQVTEKLLGEKIDASYEAKAIKELNNL